MIKQVSHNCKNWAFKFKQGGLSSSALIDKIADDCHLFRPPTMIFSDNECVIKHENSDFCMKYNAEEALKYINFEYRKDNYCGPDQEPSPTSISYIPEKLYIKHAEKWKNLTGPKDIEITEIQQSSDCFFITPFKGQISGKVKIEKTKENVIPVHKLGPENPIEFYFQGFLYQDELDDNGLVVYDYKFRSMKSSWFGLIRMYARIDDVAILILDTRIYWEEGWNKIARQFMVKKNTWAEMKDKQYEFKNGWTMDPNQSHHVYPALDERFVDNEYIHFG